MNGKIIFCLAWLASLLLSSCAREQSQMNCPGEEAKRLALKEAGFMADEVEFKEGKI